MKKNIKRGEVYEGAINDCLKDLDKLINDIEGHIYDPKLSCFGWLGHIAFRGMNAAIVAGRPKEDIWRYLCLAADFFRAHYGNVIYQGRRIYIYIEGKEYKISKSKKFTGKEYHNTFLEPEYWVISYALFALIHDDEKFSFLLTEIDEKIMRKYSNKTDTFLDAEFALIESIVAYRSEIPLEKLTKVYNTSFEKIQEEENKKCNIPEFLEEDKIYYYRTKIVVQQLVLIDQLFIDYTSDEFNTNLHEIISDYKNYYEEYGDHDVVPEAWIYLLATQVLSDRMRRHNLTTIPFKTDYIPMWIAEKSIEIANKKIAES